MTAAEQRLVEFTVMEVASLLLITLGVLMLTKGFSIASKVVRSAFPEPGTEGRGFVRLHLPVLATFSSPGLAITCLGLVMFLRLNWR